MSETTIACPDGSQREREDQLAWLKGEVQKGLDAIDEGRVVSLDPEDIKRRGRARLAALKQR
jgi:hypothetical protein